MNKRSYKAVKGNEVADILGEYAVLPLSATKTELMRCFRRIEQSVRREYERATVEPDPEDIKARIMEFVEAAVEEYLGGTSDADDTMGSRMVKPV